MAMQDNTITCNVKSYRMEKGWSQEDLAERIGVRRQAVYDIESGRYLPNTAIALRLARVFACRVEDLFVEEGSTGTQPVRVITGPAEPNTRLVLGRVRNRLVGFPLRGAEALSFGFNAADGILSRDGTAARILAPPGRLEGTVLLMGCDPAFEILSQHVARAAPDARVHCRFGSSLKALGCLGDGDCHVAGTHFHNTDDGESNVRTARELLSGHGARVVGFSLLEEGLMVAPGNPLGIRSVTDLARPGLRFANREPGAALRALLDDQLRQAGIAADEISDYRHEVTSHREGAYRVLCRVADAAMGLRAVAEIFGLDFIPITAVRCDLVIPVDLEHHPTLRVLLDVLQSAGLRREIDALAGYSSSVTGSDIAKIP